MARSIDDHEKRLAELKKEVTKRDFDLHASVLKNVSELSTELQSPAVIALAEHEVIQTIIAFPPQIQRGWHYVPKQALLFTPAGITHLLASIWPDQEPQVTCLQGRDLMYMRVTLLLLYGFLEIVAKGEDAPVRLALEFNTVNWYYLWPPLQRFVEATKVNMPGSKGAYSLSTQQTLKTLPRKFSNGLQLYGLLRGEELEEAAFQASMWKRRLYFFWRPIAANTLLLLTSHYVVVIQEELNVKQGWIISYIPRNNIVETQNCPAGPLNELSIQLKREDQSVDYKLKLKRETVEDWHKQWIQHDGRWEDLSEQQG
ncbi:MAG TPA: hypothetical protein VLE49_16840 [Anaerolineales bacterium]|nr:hypothetical protein [Anaerolineales bacterium]